ncbi:unnamed protein product [Musa acuminata subsp. malaccensis]|uniref:(wild Malaysian banana) hypothetical protein n=1 Tax=Musa acuminata subsp. malaccensis TaxID=214687 RepID=A0A804ITG2_MUSAM|nr:unnamed protein product [Musa acuminata subsp. malaccensis]
MVKNLMEDKKLDFDAPLLSVRRLSAEAAAAAAAAASSSSSVPPAYGSGESGRKPPPRRFSLPFYRSELKSGPVCNPGVVPFVWEQTPGQPKSGGGRQPTVKELHSSREATAPPAKLGSSIGIHKSAAFNPSEGAAASPEAAKEEDLKADNRSQQQPTQAPNNTNNNDDDDDDGDVFTDAPDALSRTESFLMNCSVSGLSSFREHVKPSTHASREPQVQDFMMARFLPAAQALASGSPQYTFRKAATPAREPTRATDRLVSENLRRSPLLHHRRPSHSTDDDGEEDDDDYDNHGRTPSGACGLLPKFSLKSSFCLFNPFPGMKHRGRHLPPPRRREIHRPQIKNSSQEEDEGTKLTSKPNRRGDSPTAQHSIGGAVSPYRYEAPPSPFREGRGFLGVPGKESNTTNIEDGSRLDLKKTHADVAHHPEAEDSDMNSVSPLQSPLPLLPPQSPSESWLLHTMPSVSSKKNPTPWSFLGLGLQPRKQALTHLEQKTNAEPSKPQRRHARFAEVFILLLCNICGKSVATCK